MTTYILIQNQNSVGEDGFSVSTFNKEKDKGHIVEVAMGEPNWFPTITQARQFLHECENGDLE